MDQLGEGVMPESVAVENKDLGREYVEAAKIGREVLGVVKYRSESNLTPYNDPRGFFAENIQAVQNKEPIREEDIAKAKRGSYGLALEATAQIAEAQLPRTGPVREDLSSLEALSRVVRGGYGLGMELYKEDHQATIEAAKVALGKRLKVAPDKVTWDEKKIMDWVTEQFNSANRRLVGGIEAIRAYMGR